MLKSKITKHGKKSIAVIISTYFFVIAFLIVSLAFSTSSSSLAVNGALLVRSSEDIRITNVQLNKTVLNSASQTVTPSYTVHTVEGGVRLTTGFSQIVYDVTVTNLSSQNVLVTNVNTEKWSNDNMQYTLENLVINETVIPAASEYTFQIKITFKDGIAAKIAGIAETIIENVMGISLNLNLMLDFTFYKMPQYNLLVNATPSDALIVFEQNSNIIETGNGSLSRVFDENSTVTWKVTKDGYFPQYGTEKMTDHIVRNIILTEFTGYTFTVVPNISDAVVTLSINGNVVATGQGTQSYQGTEIVTIDYTVTRYGYEDVTGSYLVEQADYTLNVTLVPTKTIEGTFCNVDPTVALESTSEVYKTGYYLVDLWGGSGADKYNVTASNTGYGGAGAHIYGIIELQQGTTIHYTIGGSGQVGQLGGIAGGNVLKSVAGANGGGSPDQDMSGSGGGYTVFMINNETITEEDISSGNVLFIAAGGGGGGGASTKNGTTTCGNGGAGGDFFSTSTAITGGLVFNGYDGTSGGVDENIGTGGSTTGGTCSAYAKAVGSFLAGGTSHDKGGAGGAGYYGGAGGDGAGNKASKASGGGGGGSSFIASSVIYKDLPEDVLAKLTTTNPSTTGGSITITYLGASY